MRKSRSHGPKSLVLKKSRLAGPIWGRGSRVGSLWELIVLLIVRNWELNICKLLKTKTIPFKGLPRGRWGAPFFLKSFARPTFVETKVLFGV